MVHGHKDATIMVGGSFLESDDGAKLSVVFHYAELAQYLLHSQVS